MFPDRIRKPIPISQISQKMSVAEWYTSEIAEETPQSHFDGNFYVRSSRKKIRQQK
jgi:hypothetical protein